MQTFNNENYKEFHSVEEAETWGKKYFEHMYKLKPESDLDIAFQLYKGRLAQLLNNKLRGHLSFYEKAEIEWSIQLDPLNKYKYQKRSDDVMAEVERNKVGENIVAYRFTKLKHIKKMAGRRIKAGSHLQIRLC